MILNNLFKQGINLIKRRILKNSIKEFVFNLFFILFLNFALLSCGSIYTILQVDPKMANTNESAVWFLALMGSTDGAVNEAGIETAEISGNISGLKDSGLVLLNNGEDELTVEANSTSFTFSKSIECGNSYCVTVKNQPTNSTCTVNKGTGTANENITNVNVVCSTDAYSIGGSISGLSASGLVLQNNSADNLSLNSGDTSFTFPTQVTGPYSVTVLSQPTGMTCNITNGSGTATANVTNVNVVCSVNTYSIGGSISELSASGLVLQNNSGDDLSLNSGDTSFTFPTQVTGAYSVTVLTQPTDMNCSVSNGSGTATANVTNVSISCSSTQNVFTVASSLSGPWGITTDGTNLYVTESSGNRIRQINISTEVLTTLAGSGSNGSADGTGTAASFFMPSGITNDGTYLYNADFSNWVVRRTEISTGVVTTYATGFNQPHGVTIAGGYLYVSQMSNHSIYRVDMSNPASVTIFAGTGSPGSADGSGTSASFNIVTNLTNDGTYLYAIEHGNHIVRRIEISNGAVTTLAGLAGNPGSADGTGTVARFTNPSGIAIDPSHTNLYIGDSGNHTIRKVVIATGEVTTIAGTGTAGSTDGTGTLTATFNSPYDLVVDGAYLYVADHGSGKIRKIQY